MQAKESEIENYRKAGLIARQVKEYARKFVKKGMLLKNIAEAVELKIQELGGKPAFPCDLSIDDMAAHSSPSSEDKTLASGLLKIDFGVSCEGYLVDTALSLDLENSEENKKLIEAAEKALENACKIIKPGIEIWKIGDIIQKTISSFKFSPIRNLSGHEISRYKVHSGITIPNYNNNNENKLGEGVYAIEPFTTTGAGIVYEGKSSGVYSLVERKAVRNQEARKLLDYIEKEYFTLPFSSRWLEKKFSNCRLALSFLEREGIIKQYPELIEKLHEKVAQAETTVLVTKEKVEVLT